MSYKGFSSLCQESWIRQNRIIHNGQWSGVSLLGSDTHGSSFNVIADSLILDNNVPMFDDNGTPIDKRDIGIAVEGPGATNNQILRNTLSGSGTDGIQVFPGCSQGYNVSGGCPGTVANDNNLIANNTVTANGFGLPLNGALGDGIALLSMGPPVVKIPTHNTVRNNTTNGNQRNGISLGGGDGQELSMDAWTTGGENYGCLISADPDNPVVDTPNLCGVTDNTVSDNSSAGNGIDGIYIGPKSDRNTVFGNTTDRNGKDGIGIGLAVRYGEGQLPVVDAAGHLVTVPGSGAQDNRLDHNAGRGSARWDGADETPGRGANRWGTRPSRHHQPALRALTAGMS